MKTLCELFRHNVESYPQNIAVHHQGRDTTYEQIAQQADALAARLRAMGLERGDRVVVLLPNSSDYVACYLGCLFASGVAVPLDPAGTTAEIASILGDCTPAAIVADTRCATRLSEVAGELSSVRLLIVRGSLPEAEFPGSWPTATLDEVFSDGELRSSAQAEEGPGLDDLAQIIYTSGTTGRPKGVTLSHRNVAANCRSILDYLKLTEADSVLVALPFYYSYGNSLLFTHLVAGGRLVLASDFVFWNRVLDLMQQQRTTGFSGVPSSFAMLLHKSNIRSRTFPDLRYVTCAGGALAPATVLQLREIVPEVDIFPMYGQTEATARLSTLLPDELDKKPGSIGRGIQGVTLEVIGADGKPASTGEVGEIVARGENVMVGYWNDPEGTDRVVRPDGLHTGDLARADEQGYLFIVGRKSDIIKSGAYRINPQEVEDVILELDTVAEVAVVGLPDDILGEYLAAFVVPSTRSTPPTFEQIQECCRGRLSRHKLVREVRFVDSLPRTSSGKVKRSELKNSADTPGEEP